MSERDVSSISEARQLATALGGGPLFVSLLRNIACGEPVEVETAADSFGVDVAQMQRLLDPLPVERDEQGRIIGLGLTLRRTPHTFEIGGKRLYTWCALDALIFPALLAVTARVTSPCAETGTLVTMTVAPDGVRGVDPPDARIVLVAPTDGADLRATFCSHVSFFASASAAHASRARAGSGTARVVTVEEGYAFGQRLVQTLSSTDVAACGG